MYFLCSYIRFKTYSENEARKVHSVQTCKQYSDELLNYYLYWNRPVKQLTETFLSSYKKLKFRFLYAISFTPVQCQWKNKNKIFLYFSWRYIYSMSTQAIFNYVSDEKVLYSVYSFNFCPEKITSSLLLRLDSIVFCL